MKYKFEQIKKGGVTSAQGFQAAGISAGIKKNGKQDMALIVSEEAAEVGATFTMNQIKAAPVKLSMRHVTKKKIKGVIFNSGNANACTGVKGITDVKTMVEKTASELNCKASEILVCSTGRIGVPLPMEKIEKGIPLLAKDLGETLTSGHDAAKAIMTSDTVAKECAVALMIDGKKVVVGGMAKGAGMIHPNMATMLACVTTDAAIGKTVLQSVTSEAVEKTFNRISVDGDTSTNDTVLVLANGKSGNKTLNRKHPDLKKFQAALEWVMDQLARMIIEDGEGISKVVELVVQGAKTQKEAKQAVEAIVRSPLVKSSWAGSDPNWGRLMDVIGYSGAKIREELVDIYYNGVCGVKGGLVSSTPVSLLKREVKKRHFKITIDLHLGSGSYWVLANDLTEAYVTFNKSE